MGKIGRDEVGSVIQEEMRVMGQYLAYILLMPGTIILLLSKDNYSGVPECSCHIVFRRARTAGNDNFGPSCLQDRTKDCRLRFDMQAYTNSKPGERLRLAKLFSQPLEEPLMVFCPANLLDALLYQV